VAVGIPLFKGSREALAGAGVNVIRLRLHILEFNPGLHLHRGLKPRGWVYRYAQTPVNGAIPSKRIYCSFFVSFYMF
jgi:hypothetical protein